MILFKTTVSSSNVIKHKNYPTEFPWRFDEANIEHLTGSWMTLLLISTTFLWQFECSDATKVGLAAGRYSGKRRPDLYRTPQALHSVLGPIGPSLHCGVFVTSQCMHFLGGPDSGDEDLIISTSSDSRDESFFFCFFSLFDRFPATFVPKSESEAAVL